VSTIIRLRIWFSYLIWEQETEVLIQPIFDEITQSAGSVPVTEPSVSPDFYTYTFVDFDGGVTIKLLIPQSNGINTSANV
jgi:hypothetical protein